ncbi:MAG: LUD domain-containing protein [Desulfomonilaceae bacterium]
MKNEEIIHLFMDNAAKVAAEPVRIANLSEMNQVLGKILENDTAIFCPNKTELEKSVEIDPARLVESFGDATATVEEVVAGIAETGSIVVTSANERAVQASLLPAHHVALISADNIFNTVDDFFSTIPEDPPTNITLITGPSRTADIELTLTIGVHGPERVSIVIV